MSASLDHNASGLGVPQPTATPGTSTPAPTPSYLSVDPEKAAADSSRASIVTGPHAEEKAKDGVPSGEPAAEQPPRNVTGAKWVLVVGSILSSIFLFALDNTVVADVQPQIIARFQSIEKLPWLGVAFLLGSVATNLIWGKMYGQFNAKYLYLISVLLFELGSALCGGANTMDTLIIGRAIAGWGGAGLYIGVMTFLSVMTTTHERPMYIGFTGVVWGLGTVLGPIVGGAFADSKATWRWAFYINLVVGAVVAPIYILLIPSIDPRPGVAMRSRFRELDYVGAVLIMGAFLSGTMAISFGGTLYEWNSGRIIGLFVCSGVLFIAFGVQQTFTLLTTVERRVFPVHFLRRRSMLLLFALASCAITTLFVPLYFVPLFFQFVRGDSALMAGVRLLPYVVFLVVAAVLNGALMSMFGVYMPWYLGGGIFALVGSVLLYTIETDATAARIYGYSILLGIGGGAFVQAGFSVAQAKVTPAEIPLAVGFISLAQIGGGTIALAIANSVFLNQATRGTARLLPDTPVATVRAIIAGRGSKFFLTLSDGLRAQVLDVIVDSISRVYILAITASALAIVLSVFLKREKLFLEAGGAA